jgi:hypothetical protein
MYAHCGCPLLWSVQPLPLLFLTPLPPTQFFNSFQYTSLYPLPSHMLCDITDALSFSFPFPLSEFHRVVPLLQPRFTCEFVYDHACFCVCYL